LIAQVVENTIKTAPCSICTDKTYCLIVYNKILLICLQNGEDEDENEPKKKVMKTEDETTKDHKSEETNKCSADTTEVPSSEKEKSKEEISKEEQSKLNSENKTKKPEIPEVDELEETLMCSICQELLYNCIRYKYVRNYCTTV